MLEDYRSKERERTGKIRSVMDYTMGVLLIIIGGCFLLYERIGFEKIFKREHSSLDYIIGGLFILYGIWRIYRGYKKNYFQ